MSPRRAFHLMFVSALLAQLAWALAVPAFRGIDEFDHAYKAAAVARGELLDVGPSEEGRGRLVPVPRDLVSAASDACESRGYTQRDNCHPVATRAHGLVTVASSATAYNPAYYAVVGTLASRFSGAWSLVVMRAATAVMCALLLGWAAAVTARWARNGWPFVSLAVALTPVLAYSTSIVSPNGLQYAAAVLVWSALLGLAAERPRPRAFLPAFTTGAAVVVATHTTGPMWLALICLTVLLLRPLRGWVPRLRSDPWPWATSALVIGLVTAGCLLWVRLAQTNTLGEPDPAMPGLTARVAAREALLWVFQSIGAFPMRDEPAAAATYVLWLLVFIAGAVLFFARATLRQRLVQLFLALCCVVVPLVLTVIAYPSLGLAWQGRYGLPLAVGMPLLAGWAFSRQDIRLPSRTAVLVLGALGVASAFSVVQVARHEALRAPHPPLADHLPLGLPLGLALAAAIAVVAPLLLLRVMPGRAVEAPVQVPEAQPVAT